MGIQLDNSQKKIRGNNKYTKCEFCDDSTKHQILIEVYEPIVGVFGIYIYI